MTQGISRKCSASIALISAVTSSVPLASIPKSIKRVNFFSEP